MIDCLICDEVGGPLALCDFCGLPKNPRGRAAPIEMVNGLCDHECAGYYLPPEPGALWPGERHGDSFGHAKWHERE